MLVDPDGRIVFDPKVIVGIYVAPHFIGHYLYKQIENNTTREFSSLDLYSLSRSGRGTNVTLSQIGLLEKVQYAIDNSEKSKPKITGTVRSRFLSQIVGESQICDNPSNFSLEFKESYKFGEVNWAIGSATLKGTFKGGVTNNEDGTKHIKGTITYTFYDVFTDPYDIPKLFPKDWIPESKS